MDDARATTRGASPWRDHGAQTCSGLISIAALGLLGCRPSIGSPCTLSTDCVTQDNMVCDTAQPGGYCTVLNCIGNSCPNSGTCVMFQVSVPGCPYDPYSAPERTGLAMCMKHCTENSDCRESDGYVCADPRESPWYAAILDANQGQRVCIAATSTPSSSVPVEVPDGSVCLPDRPPLPDASPDGLVSGADAASSTTLEAGGGPDAGIDATLDSGATGEGGSGANEDASDGSGDAIDEDPAGDAEGP